MWLSPHPCWHALHFDDVMMTSCFRLPTQTNKQRDDDVTFPVTRPQMVGWSKHKSHTNTVRGVLHRFPSWRRVKRNNMVSTTSEDGPSQSWCFNIWWVREAVNSSNLFSWVPIKRIRNLCTINSKLRARIDFYSSKILNGVFDTALKRAAWWSVISCDDEAIPWSRVDPG